MSNYKDMLDRNPLYYKEYYEKNKEKLREYTKLWGRKRYGSKPRSVIKHTNKTVEESIKRKRNSSKESYLKKTYNIGMEQYNILFSEQEGKCAICGIHQTDLKHPLYVDHCHNTGIIRGLLCRKCNFAIGLFSENVIFIDNAKKYLENFNGFINL
jgi:hypothetical protein